MPLSIQQIQEKLTRTPEGDKCPEAHEKVLSHVKNLIAVSRKEMARHYTTWDYHDQVFRSQRPLDKEDRSANAKGQPAKLIVPLTFSQIMTFVSYCVMTVTQNKRFFELSQENSSPENLVLKESLEKILERDTRRNNWYNFLVQYFLDLSRFWIGCAEVCYKEEIRYMRIPRQEKKEGLFGNVSVEATNAFMPIPVFVGNKVYPLSPYRFFPDTRLPLTRYQEGEFCGSEDMFSYVSLLADRENLFNLDCIEKFDEQEYNDRRKKSRIDTVDFMPQRAGRGPDTDGPDKDRLVKSGNVVVTKIVCDIIPANFTIEEDVKLGKETFPIRYIIWYANDKTIIRFEEATYLHGRFPYVCAQYLPDQHKTVNEGLSSVCDQITNLITWKLNAHLTAQKSVIDTKFVIDPAGVDIKTLESRSPYIFLKSNMAQMGVDRYIKQFKMEDPTANVMTDIAALKQLLEAITGISAQMSGQYSDGRRSATQDRVVAQGAAARAKTTLSTVWDSFVLLGQQFIANNRQEMDLETFQRIVGPGPFGPQQNVPVEQLYALFKADPATIASAEDYFVFDGTQPSEKAFLAQSLQEVFMALVSNPAIMQVLGYGPEQLRYIFNEIYELRGVTPPSLPAQQPAMVSAPAAPQSNVVPMAQPDMAPAMPMS